MAARLVKEKSYKNGESLITIEVASLDSDNK